MRLEVIEPLFTVQHLALSLCWDQSVKVWVSARWWLVARVGPAHRCPWHTQEDARSIIIGTNAGVQTGV